MTTDIGHRMLTPFSTAIDLATGEIDVECRVVTRTLDDVDGVFEAPCSGTDLVYEVFNLDVPERCSELQTCTTRLHPGRVGDEYFMTKGHFHEVRDRSEIYLTTSGVGRLILATAEGETVVEEMTAGSMNYIPGGWSHRSVNVGEVPLVFFAAYIGDSGHDYATIEQRGFPVLVKASADGPVVVPNPRYVSDD
jgi:glucose-6-phosphate isomerase, archaeal